MVVVVSLRRVPSYGINRGMYIPEEKSPIPRPVGYKVDMVSDEKNGKRKPGSSDPKISGSCTASSVGALRMHVTSEVHLLFARPPT